MDATIPYRPSSASPARTTSLAYSGATAALVFSKLWRRYRSCALDFVSAVQIQLEYTVRPERQTAGHNVRRGCTIGEPRAQRPLG